MILAQGSCEARDLGSQRTALAWDPRGRWALVVGGVDRSDTWVAEGGAWRRLATGGIVVVVGGGWRRLAALPDGGLVGDGAAQVGQ